MAEHRLELQVKWWVRPYIYGLYVWASVWWFFCWHSLDEAAVNDWCERQADFVARHGVVPAMETIA